jgi:hypothetical protein
MDEHDAFAKAHFLECLSCAKSLYRLNPPSPTYAHRVARFLLATAAHESNGFKETRQRGFTWNNQAGGFGMYQIEPIAWLDVRARLLQARNKALAIRAAHWLYRDDRQVPHWFNAYNTQQIHEMLCLSPRLSLMVARVLMLRVPEAIPDAPDDMAVYWGKHYNTRELPQMNAQWLARYDGVEKHMEVAP